METQNATPRPLPQHRRPRRRWAQLVAILLLFATALQAQDLFYEAYERGEKAYKEGNLAEARRMFERALQIEPRQSRQRRTYGSGARSFIVYIPEYYLARIDVREKRFKEAMQRFDSLRAAGLIKEGQPEYATLVAERATAEQGLSAAATPSSGERGAPKPEGQRARVDLPSGDRPDSKPPTPVTPTPSGTPPPAGRGEAPKPTPTPVVPAPPVAPTPDPAAEVQKLTDEVTRLVTAREFGRAWETADKADALAAKTGQPAGLAARVRDGIARAGEARLRQGDVAGATRLSELLTTRAAGSAEAARLTALLTTQREDSRMEREAFKQLLLGDYRKVLELTSPVLERDRPSARLLFYAACGRAALSLTATGPERVSLTADARRLFQRATAAGTSFSKEAPYISPGVLGVLRPQ